MLLPAPFTWCQLSWSLCSPSLICRSLYLLSTEVSEWSYFPVLIFLWPSLFVWYFQRWVFWLYFLLPHSSGHYWTEREETEKLSLSICDFHLIHIFSPISHFFFFFFLPLLTSSSLVILSQWTSGTDGKRRSWTLVPLSRLTHLGHRSTSALTSHPSALTKSRLRWLPAAVNFSGSHGVCLWAKCPLESKPGCLYGGRHLFLETMSKYKSAQDTPTTLIRNKFMDKMCAESHVYWNIYLTQNWIEIIYFRFPFISFLHLIKVLNHTQPSPDFCLLFVFRRQCIFLDKLQLNYNLKGWHLAEILLVHVILSNSMHSFASKHKMWNTSEENYSAHACITKSCW